MAKDPAFLMYSQDFLTGTMTLSFEDKGKYITILLVMHQQGRLKEETIRFLVGSVSDNLKSKFRIDKNGLWFNERLEAEAEKRSSFTESRRKNGKKGGRPKKSIASGEPNDNPKQNHMVSHMGNENENENENENKEGVIGETILFQKEGPEDHTRELMQYFSVSEALQPQWMMEIDRWVRDMSRKGDLEYAKKQLAAYKQIKVNTGQSRCSWRTWIQGLWNEMDYTSTLQQSINGKKSVSTIVHQQLRDDPEYKNL